MTLSTWRILINTFEVNTRNSNKKMNSLATDTEAKLHAETSDPDILALHTGYFPVYDAYRQIYINYDVAAGNLEGETLNVETLITTELPKEVKKWEGFVRSIYVEDSPQERAIFPNKRSPFTHSTYEDRISAVGSLAARLSTDVNPIIQGYAPTVQSFYNILLSARNVQQNQEGMLNLLSETREEQRILLANELYGVLGGLMRKFKADPQQVARFFDLSLLRDTGGAEEEPATTVGISLPTNQTTPGTVVLKIKGSALTTGTEQFKINWGDGTSTIETLENGVLADYSHIYTTSGQFIIQVIPITAGVLELFDVLQFDNCQLNGTITLHESVRPSGFQFPNNLVTNLSMQQSSYINLNSLVPYNNNMDATAVNEALIKLNNSGQTNGFANFGGGTNDAPTGQGIAAKNSLIAKGWTVITN